MADTVSIEATALLRHALGREALMRRWLQIPLSRVVEQLRHPAPARLDKLAFPHEKRGETSDTDPRFCFSVLKNRSIPRFGFATAMQRHGLQTNVQNRQYRLNVSASRPRENFIATCFCCTFVASSFRRPARSTFRAFALPH